MRKLLLLLLTAASAVHAQSFPFPAAPERGVSDVVRTGAFGPQIAPLAATNGDMTLVAWNDARGAVYAARVDAAGNLLDPNGLRLMTASLNAVVWNGETFVVAMGINLAFITPDGSVTIPRPGLELGYVFLAATPGPDVRFLYADGLRLALVDKTGLAFARRTIASSVNILSQNVGAGGDKNGFVLVRAVTDFVNNSRGMVSDRIDRNGNIPSSKANGLPIMDGLSIAGGPNGFLMVRAVDGISVYRLDTDGVFTGQSRTLDVTTPGWHAVVRDDNRYLVAWQSSTTDNIAEIDDGDSIAVHGYGEPAGVRRGIALASYRGNRVLATSVDRPGFGSDADVFVRQLTPALSASEAHLITFSATRQANAAVAAGVNGFAVTWGETGPDANTHLYVRRFSEGGVPQDDAPLLAYSWPDSFGLFPPRPTIVSNSETYLLGWLTPDGPVIRRLAAGTGAWLDPIPIPLNMKGAIHLASNGVDAIAIAENDLNRGEPLTARRINLSGAPLTSPVITFRSPGGAIALGGLDVASNGSDYLMAWIEGAFCVIPCGGVPSRLFAMRLRADATAIDPAPLSLDGDQRSQGSVSVASAAGLYLVTWSSGQAGVRATRITAEGAVLDRDAQGGGVVIESAVATRDSVSAAATRIGNHFALMIRHEIFNPLAGTSTRTLSGLTFEPNMDLYGVAALPRIPLAFIGDVDGPFTIAMASRGLLLAIAYSRITSGQAGDVSRAYLRLLSEPPPRRRAAVY